MNQQSLSLDIPRHSEIAESSIEMSDVSFLWRRRRRRCNHSPTVSARLPAEADATEATQAANVVKTQDLSKPVKTCKEDKFFQTFDLLDQTMKRYEKI